MTDLIDAVPYLAAYKTSFIVLATLSLVTLIQNFLAAPLAFANEEQIPGMPLRLDPTKLSFRAIRTYANSTETLPTFLTVVIVAIASGVEPSVVNVIAAIVLWSRIAYWVIYYSGYGRHAGGPRTIVFVGGQLANIVLVGFALWNLI